MRFWYVRVPSLNSYGQYTGLQWHGLCQNGMLEGVGHGWWCGRWVRRGTYVVCARFVDGLWVLGAVGCSGST